MDSQLVLEPCAVTNIVAMYLRADARVGNLRYCIGCKQMQPLNCFFKSKGNKDGYLANCKTCHTARVKKYHSENPEIHKKSAEKYRLNNPEKVRKSALKWQANNREKIRHYDNVRRTQKIANGVFKILDKELKKLYQSSCFYCGATGKIHADHIIPIAKGGVHSIGNLVPACSKCNQSKGKKLLVEWKTERLSK